MDNDLSKLLSASRSTIKNSLSTNLWWKYVSKDVKSSILYVVQNIDEIGIPFKNAFRAVSDLQKCKRQIDDKSASKIVSALFGQKLTEEEYQCGAVAVKSAMDLNDWERPSESDVYVCRHLCSQIEALENLGVIYSGQIPSRKKDNKTEMSRTIMPSIDLDWDTKDKTQA